MSVLAPAGPRGELPARLALAVAATLLVGGLAVWLAGSLAPAPPPRVPFGVGPREALPSPSGLGGMLLGWQSVFFSRLREALAALKADGRAWPVLGGLGFAYGVFHAAGPGHGKAVISAYIVAGERALRRGLALSLAAALIQAGIAIVLVATIFRLLGGTAAAMTRTAEAVELAGFGLVAALGLVLVWRNAGRVAALWRVDPAGADECAACALHAAPATPGWRPLAAVALGAGIRPCAGALVVLTFAQAQGLAAAGIAAVLAMALGTALTTSALAGLAVYGKRLALGLAGRRAGRHGPLLAAGIELAAAALLLCVGLALLMGAGAGASGA